MLYFGQLLFIGAFALSPLFLIPEARSSEIQAQAAQTLLRLDQESTLVAAMKSRADISKDLSADGAMGANLLWEQDPRTHPVWYVEEQRSGFTAALGAALNHSPLLAQQAEKAFEWAFRHQNEDGSFNMPSRVPIGRQIHSTALFIEAASHGLLLMEASGMDPDYVTRRGRDLVRAALYLSRTVEGSPQGIASLSEAAKTYDQGHAHRLYEKAAALLEAAAFAQRDPEKALLIRVADLCISQALDPQNPLAQVKEGSFRGKDAHGESFTTSLKGVNPENDHPSDPTRPLHQSYDSSYEALGLYYASLYVAITQNPDLKAKAITLLSTAMGWEASRMLLDGRADLRGNTRISDQGSEQDPSGKPKVFGYQTAMFVFSYAGVLLNEPGYRKVSQAIARLRHWVH